MSKRFPFLILVALTVSLAACDSAVGGADSVFLNAELSADTDGDPVRFVFESSEVQTGRLMDVECDCELDVTEFLADRGFSKNDIISATVKSARLVMLFPISERLNFLDEAILKMRAPGNSITEVARQGSFGETREVALEPLTGRDVSGFMDNSSFEPILQIDAATLQAGASYEIGLVLEIRLELAGV